MKNGFIEIADLDSLDSFLAHSSDTPIIILKHSNECGISTRAYAQMSKLERPVGIVTVQKARAVSNEIEERMGVAHETPQVLILRDGKVAWMASHGQVRAEAVEAAWLEISKQWAVSRKQ